MLKSESLKRVSKVLVFFMVFGVVSSLIFSPTVSAARSLRNPNATQAAKNVYAYLNSVYGSKMLSAQMESAWDNTEISYIKSVSGKEPAIRGLDFMSGDYNGVVTRATEWWNRGGIPTICWHWGAPPNGDSGYEASKGTADIGQILTEGTSLNKAFKADLDKGAAALKKLQDAGVPVLWRPYHEFDGGWFWWGKGGADSFKKLWIYMYNYYTKTKGLNNLIWVLGYSGEVKSGWYPGDEYVDIAGADTYSTGTQNAMFKKVKAVVGNEIPVCYHECGAMPDPDAMLADGTRWLFFMVWHTSYIKQTNSADTIKKVYNHNFVITLDELPNFKTTIPTPTSTITPTRVATPTPISGQYAEPVNPKATQEARNVLNYIYSIYGKNILSGQQEAGWDTGKELTWLKNNIGKYPAILGLDMGDRNSGMADRAIAYWKDGGIPMIGWHIGAPNQDDSYEGSKKYCSIDKALTPGTNEYNTLMKRLDEGAATLKKLQDNNVPCIWRPFHEAGSSNWFWWSMDGAENYMKLWKFMYNYYTNTKGLNNLIWMNPQNGTPLGSYFPGSQWCDMAGADTYDTGTHKGIYDKVASYAGTTMPIALHENGSIPDPDKLKSDGAKWVLFNTWNQSWLYNNGVDYVKKVYNHSYVITRDELPDLKTGGITTPTPTRVSTIQGDVSKDGVVDSADYTILRSYLLGKSTLSSDALKAADMNVDGVVDSGDYTLLRRKLLGQS